MLTNKVIIITGGAGLLGSAFCKGISEQGGKVVIADISFDRAEKLSSEIDSSLPFELDITSDKSISSLIDSAHKKYGKIDAIVNNAYPRNKQYGRKFEDVEYNDFCDNISMNLGGYFLTSKLLYNYFINQGFGNIINIGSIYGVIAPRFEIYQDTNMTMPVEYSVIKSGLIHLTKYIATYAKGKNIRVNSLCPGGIIDSQPESFLEGYNGYSLNKGMLDPSDLVGSLLFLLSEQSHFINGQNIVVDDGFTL